jgi:ParB-like chromosome segregation protein Spo0J/DNA modification methylase
MQSDSAIPFSSVIVGDRFRKDYGDLTDLIDSIPDIGLIQPIVLSSRGDGTFDLVAGGRRYAALAELHTETLYHAATCQPGKPGFIFADELSLEHRQEAELVENVARKDYSWQERLLNIVAVHELKTRRAVLSGMEWGYRQTGALLNLPLASVGRAIQVCSELRKNPEGDIAKAATFTDAYRLLLQRAEDAAKAELARRTLTPTTNLPAPPKIVIPGDNTSVPTADIEIGLSEPATDTSKVVIPLSSMLVNEDCIEYMKSCRPEVFDHCITDTPYGIDMDMLDQQNPHGGMNDVDRIRDTHDVEQNMDLFARMMPEVFRTLRPSGFFITWADIMQWQYLYDLATAAGFKVQRWPVTWVKMHQCMNQSAQYNFTKNTEIAIIMRKPGATLAKPASNCTIMAANSVAAKKLGHPFVKPFEVWEYLVRHVAIPGQTIYEPCAGVGSGVLSFLQLGMKVVATEIDKKHYDQLVINVSEHFKTAVPNCEFV